VIPRVVVAGCGVWGRNHVRTLHELGALAGVVELLPALRERIQEEYPGLPVWRSLDQAFPHVDGVVVATRPWRSGPWKRARACWWRSP